MRVNLVRILVSLAISGALISGCSLFSPAISSDLQESFNDMVSISNLNRDLKVKVMKVESHKFGTDVGVIVENRGKNPIFISAEPTTPFIKVFGIQDGQWVEIRNQVNYINTEGEQGFPLMPPSSARLNLFTTVVRPVFEPNSNTEGNKRFIRILVVGEAMEDDQKTGVPVGAYADLTLDP